jgi:hypothetical protein
VCTKHYGLPIEPQLVVHNEAVKRVAEQKQVTDDRLRARRDTAADESEYVRSDNKLRCAFQLAGEPGIGATQAA